MDEPPARHRPGPRRADAEAYDDPALGDDAWLEDEAYEEEAYEEEWDDDDYVDVRPPSATGRRILLIVLVLFVALMVFAGGALLWVRGQLDPSGGPGEPVAIEVPEGATSDDIGRLLAEADVIKSDFVWQWYLRINGGGPFEAGLYEIPTNSAVSDAIDVLSAGPKPPEELGFTVPEGLTTVETLARLADPEVGLGLDLAELQQLMASGEITSSVLGAGLPSDEGILFPETYKIDEDDDAAAILRRMVAQLDQTLTELDVASAEARFGLSPYEILIVASLIEEETKVDAERGKVARVIYNRLQQGIPLGIDATSRYEAVLAGRSREDIDFESDSPYNTRRVAGLPPTPIASPGRASIEAALNPEEGPWIYYVLQDAEGNHFFTDSNSEFINAKNRCAELGLGCG